MSKKSPITIAALLSVFAVLSGVLNYITYPILIHSLSIQAYAEVSVFVSLMGIMGIPTAAFTYAMMVDFRQNFAWIQKASDVHKKKIIRFSVYYMLLGIVFYTIAYFALGLSSPEIVLLILFSMIPAFVSAFYYGLLQAKEFFIFLGILGLVGAVLRLLLSFSVYLFPTAFVGMLPFIVPWLLTFFWMFYVGRKVFAEKSHSEEHHTEDLPARQSMLNFLIITGAIIFLQNVDVLIVKALLTDYDVALYAAVSVIVKFILVFISILDTITLPVLVDQKQKHLHKKYASILVSLSLVWSLLATVLLPWLGSYMLTLLKPEFSVPASLWVALTFAVVWLGFFSLFAKVIVARKIPFYSLAIIPTLGLVSMIFVRDLQIFSYILAGTFIGIYSHTLFLFYKNRS